MWDTRSVEVFLGKRELPREQVAAIRSRMEGAVRQSGTEHKFSAALLEQVMGDANLARAFKQDWETDVDLHAALHSP